jgi:hypothetical protein
VGSGIFITKKKGTTMPTTANIKLSLINSMLRTLGSAPLAGADTSHPDYITANAVLEEVIEDFSSKPLWFNNSIETLSQDNDGRVPVPTNAVAVDPTDGSNLAVAGNFLYNVDKRTDIIGKDVECYVHREIELELMPREALKFIRAACRFKFYADEDGGVQKLQVYAQAAQLSELELNSVNIARMDMNFFASGSGRTFFIPRPSNYQHIGSSAGSGGVKTIFQTS